MYGGGRGEFEHGDGFDRIESHFKDFMASHGSKPHHDDEYYNECPPPDGEEYYDEKGHHHDEKGTHHADDIYEGGEHDDYRVEGGDDY